MQQQQRSICPFCNKELKNSHSLTVHISRYHNPKDGGSTEVVCPVCKKTYGNKYSLRTHMHLNHKDQLHLLGSSRRRRGPRQPQQLEQQQLEEQQQ